MHTGLSTAYTACKRPLRARRRMLLAILVSLLVHGFLLSMQTGLPGPGWPALDVPWMQRRATAERLNIDLATTTPPAAVPAPRRRAAAESGETQEMPAPANALPTAKTDSELMVTIVRAPAARKMDNQKTSRKTMRPARMRPPAIAMAASAVIAQEKPRADTFAVAAPNPDKPAASPAGERPASAMAEALAQTPSASEADSEQAPGDKLAADDMAQRLAAAKAAHEEAIQEAAQKAAQEAAQQTAREAAQKAQQEATEARQQAAQRLQAQQARMAAEQAAALAAQVRHQQLQAQQQAEAAQRQQQAEQQAEQRAEQQARQRERQQAEAAAAQASQQHAAELAREQQLARLQAELQAELQAAQQAARQAELQRQQKIREQQAQQLAQQLKQQQAAQGLQQQNQIAAALAQEKAAALEQQQQARQQAEQRAATALQQARQPAAVTASGSTASIGSQTGTAGADLASHALEQLRNHGKGQSSAERAAREGTMTSGRRSIIGNPDHDLGLSMYVASWQQKIERNGELNYSKLLAQRAHIDPIVTVALRSDGSIDDIKFNRSSGRPELDAAVRRILNLNARYGAFPPDLARRYDVIEIRRIWRFGESLKIVEDNP
jgi:hypothetical protein